MNKIRNRKIGKKVLLFVFGGLLGIVLIGGIVVFSISNKNVKSMNRCVEGVLEEINSKYNVASIDPGEYKDLKLFGIMKFKVEQYEIEELGNLSIMRVNMGVMQMATVVITPRDKNLPLLSADYMYILNNRKNYLEFYDLVKNSQDAKYQELLSALSQIQEDYAHLDDIEVSPAWYQDLLTVKTYKGGSSAADMEMQNLLVDSISEYLDHAKTLPALTDSEKSEKLAMTKTYTDGLIEKGGISTDVFKEQLGEEVTMDFFDKVFFGTSL